MSVVEQRLMEISEVEDQMQKLHLQAGEHRAQVKISKNTLASCKTELEKPRSSYIGPTPSIAYNK